MNYPLISEYVSSIESVEDNFGTLTSLRPVMTNDGRLFMSSGNFAGVFKMRDAGTGKLYAVKCFTKEETERFIVNLETMATLLQSNSCKDWTR